MWKDFDETDVILGATVGALVKNTAKAMHAFESIGESELMMRHNTEYELYKITNFNVDDREYSYEDEKLLLKTLQEILGENTHTLKWERDDAYPDGWATYSLLFKVNIDIKGLT